MWVRFWDMHSGGSRKLSHDLIFIEAPETEAKSVFFSRFGRNPERVTCTCCGPDYSVDKYTTLKQATAFDRGCAYGYIVNGERKDEDYFYSLPHSQRKNLKGIWFEEPGPKRTFGAHYMTLWAFLRKDKALVIPAKQIQPHERTVRVPKQGFVWV